jgi:16S rRNA processing protein RimM
LTDLLAVGIVSAAHGVKGELAVRSFSGAVAHIVRLQEAVARRGKSERRLTVKSARPRAADVLMTVEGVDSREKAQALIGYELWVPREMAAPLAEGEYYEADLCGCGLFFGTEMVGTVRSVLEAGQSQLLDVAGADGKGYMIPFIDHFIGEVDVKSGKISLREDDILR